MLVQIQEHFKLFHWIVSGEGLKMDVATSRDTKVFCIVRMSVWIELIFHMLTVMQ